LVVFLVVSALTGQTEEEKDRVSRLFDEARRSGVAPVSAAPPASVLTNEALAEAPSKS
jgi:hypothetical protein